MLDPGQRRSDFGATGAETCARFAEAVRCEVVWLYFNSRAFEDGGFARLSLGESDRTAVRSL